MQGHIPRPPLPSATRWARPSTAGDKCQGVARATPFSFIDIENSNMTAIPEIKLPAPSPRLSDRNLARFVRMAASRQMRFLHDQKFPRGEPQVFMQPYYSKAIACIRDAMKRGVAGIIDSRAKLEGISQVSKRVNNQRVFEAFVNSRHAKRRLVVVSGHRYYAYARTMEVKFSPHVVARDGDETKYIYFHEKGEQCDPE